mgnify:CR=1 FL=1
MSIPRPPTEEELQLLNRALIESGTIPPEDDLTTVREHGYIAVFDDYITDGPCYAGSIMLVVWSSAPDYYQAYTWRGKDKLELVSQLLP